MADETYSESVEAASSAEFYLLQFYGTIEEADAYFLYRPVNSLWINASLNQKRAALAEAASIIDLYQYKSRKTDAAQGLEFPRVEFGLPTQVKQAGYELAYAVFQGLSVDSVLDRTATQKEEFMEVRTTYFPNKQPAHISAGIPSGKAYALLLPYFVDNRTVRINRTS